jgi:hypothetical protein
MAALVEETPQELDFEEFCEKMGGIDINDSYLSINQNFLATTQWMQQNIYNKKGKIDGVDKFVLGNDTTKESTFNPCIGAAIAGIANPFADFLTRSSSSNTITGTVCPYSKEETMEYCINNKVKYPNSPSAVIPEVALALCKARHNHTKKIFESLNSQRGTLKWNGIISISITGDFGEWWLVRPTSVSSEASTYPKPPKYYAAICIEDEFGEKITKVFGYFFDNKGDLFKDNARGYVNDRITETLLNVIAYEKYCKEKKTTPVYSTRKAREFPTRSASFKEFYDKALFPSDESLLDRDRVTKSYKDFINKLHQIVEPEDTINDINDSLTSSSLGGSKKLSRKKRRNRKRSSTTRK